MQSVPRLLVLAVPLVAGGCADPWSDPEATPLRLVEVVRLHTPAVPVDLDLDGRDELLMYGEVNHAGVGSLVIRTLGGDIVEQVNVGAAVLRPAAVNLDADDPLEVLLPFVRDDTLHALVLDHEGRRLQSVAIASGQPRQTEDGPIPWDPLPPWFGTEDVDGDGDPELVTLVTTGFARAPRGVYVHDLATGEEISSHLIGAMSGPASFPLPVARTLVAFDDIDGDGHREVAFWARPSDNGARLRGFNDATAYVGVLDVAPSPGVAWSEPLGGLKSEPAAHLGDFDGDGSPDLFVSVHRREAKRGRLEMRDPATGEVSASRSMDYRRLTVMESEDASDQILVLRDERTVDVLDAGLRTVRSSRLPTDAQAITSSEDLDGDGAEEVVVRADEHLVWLDDELKPRALMAVGAFPIRAGAGEPPLLGANGVEGFRAYRVERNPLYLVYRYGPVGAALLGAALVLGTGFAFRRLRRENRRLGDALARREAEVAEREAAGAFDERAWRLTARRVAHDLRNPLTSVLLNAEHLRRAALDHGDPDAAERYARRIEERVERLRRVTRNFLKFVDLEALSRRETTLGAFLDDVAEDLRGGLPPDVELVVRTEADAPTVRLDPEQMASVVENLVANALDALPEGGRITLSAHSVHGVQLNGEATPRDWVVLEVRDTGTGIDTDLRDRLFEPGVSGSSDGAGFGLAVVRKTVADHGGYVEVESEPGVGTVFSVFLPAADAFDPEAAS